MCAPDLKAETIAALAGTTAQHPMDTHAIITKTRRQRGRVEVALGELYQVRSVYCCKITDKEGERVVWWVSGNVPSQTEFYGKRAVTIDMKKAEAAGFVVKPSKPVRKLSPMSTAVKQQIHDHPGMSMAEILAMHPKDDALRVMNAVTALKHGEHVRFEGGPRKFRYFPNEVAQ